MQNSHVEHGIPSHFKGVVQTKPTLRVAQDALAKLQELTEDRPDVQMSIMFECHSLAKITSLPDDAAACLRSPYPNVMVVVRWKENSIEAEEWAQNASWIICAIVTDANDELKGPDKLSGYGNYGKNLLITPVSDTHQP